MGDPLWGFLFSVGIPDVMVYQRATLAALEYIDSSADTVSPFESFGSVAENQKGAAYHVRRPPDVIPYPLEKA